MNYSPITSVFRTQLAPGDNVAAYDLNQEHKTPIQIDGFRFSVQSDRVVGTPGYPGYLPAFNEPGTYVDWGLQIGGREARLGDLVPLVASCPRKGYADGGGLNGPNSTLPNGTYYEFKLKKPTFVLPGTRVYALLRYNPLAPAGSGKPVALDVTIEMYGKSIDLKGPPPELIDVPMIQAWRAPAVAISASAAVQQSSPDSALGNPEKESVRVTSMLACIATSLWAGEILPSARIQISSSNDGYFVREPTPIMELFSGRSRLWEIACTLQPKEYWTVDVSYDGTSLLEGTTDYVDTDQLQAIVGLVGYRTVPLNTLYRETEPEVGRPAVVRAQAGMARGVPQRITPALPPNGVR